MDKITKAVSDFIQSLTPCPTPYLCGMEVKSLVEDVLKVSGEAAAFIHSQAGKVKSHEIESKSRNSLVSYVDKTAEEILVKGLRAILPEAGFITEEETVEQTSAAYTWIIDPLDGTTNFLQQIPIYAVSVALRHHHEIILGVVINVELDEVFYAWKGGGSWCNGLPIRVSELTDLREAVVATGFPYASRNILPQLTSVFHHFLENARGIRRLGSAAVDMAYVACGRFDAYYETSLNAWDIAGGIIIVEEAGGIVTDFSGAQDMLRTGSIIAAPPGIHESITGHIQKFFPA